MPEAGHGGFHYQDRATHFKHQPLLGQEIALAGSHYRGHYLRVEVRYIEDFLMFPLNVGQISKTPNLRYTKTVMKCTHKA